MGLYVVKDIKERLSWKATKNSTDDRSLQNVIASATNYVPTEQSNNLEPQIEQIVADDLIIVQFPHHYVLVDFCNP